jgi:hypothetical protein
MSVTQHAPTTTATRKPRKPDPARVVQSYHHEVQARGKRGAFRRTGDLYNISDESVRRYLAADEQRAQVKPALPDELAYTPAPGESSYLAERDRIAAQLATEQRARPATAPAIRHKDRSHCHPKGHRIRVRSCGDVMSRRCGFERKTVANMAEMPQLTIATRHAVERPQSTTAWHTTPQIASPPTRNTLAHTIKHYAPRPTRPGVNVSALIMQVFQPGPMLAVILFAILVGLIYWK